MSKHRDTSLNRREFLSRTGRGAMMAGGGAIAAHTVRPAAVLAQAPEQAAEQAASSGEAFLAGWATITITPDKPVQLHGQFHERVSEKVLDPCMATALAIERTGEGPEQAIMVSCDIVNMDREVAEDVRRRVSERLPDFDAKKLFLNATHTHTGPTMMKGLYKDPDPGVITPAEYAEFFAAQVAEAAVQAWTNRQPAGVSRGFGHAAVGFNRVARYADGSSVMYGKTSVPEYRGPEGACDHGLEMLFFWDSSNAMTGTVINIACPSQVVEGQLYVSADFWGAVREELRKIHSPDLFVYAMVSAAGNQSPRDLTRRGRTEPEMRDEPGMREMARRIVNGFEDALKTRQTEVERAPIFRHHVEELSLPARRVTDAEAEEARAELARVGEAVPGSREAALVRRANKTLSRHESQGSDPRYSMDLHVIRLGDAAIATNPFELYIEYGMQIKSRSRAHQTFLVQLTGDRGLYLPTKEAVAGGAYGSRVADNAVGPEGGAALVERTVEVISGMWEA